MEFSPTNPIVQLCIQSMIAEEKGNTEEAGKILHQAWSSATNDFEKFLAAHATARHSKHAADRLRWFTTALELALAVDTVETRSALSTLYDNIAKCHEDLGNPDEAKKYHGLATSSGGTPSDPGPFFHGTRADLQLGDLLTAGGKSNYEADLVMNHIYFTALLHGAGLAAAMAKGEGRERVYVVEPTGSFEPDPNVTDKKFPGNLTRSYRSTAPLKIIGEATNWTAQTPEELQKWKEKLAGNKGEIIN